MNKKYIEVDKISWQYLPLAVMPDMFVTKEAINNMEPAKVKEEIFAEWIFVNDRCGCSNCRMCLSYDGNGVIIDMSHLPFCPHCGATMTNATLKPSSRKDIE